MSEQIVGTGTEDTAAQDRIVDYVSVVLEGERAQELRGVPRLIDLTGTPDQRRMYGGIFVAAILHYYEDPGIENAPVNAATSDRQLWRDGFNTFQDLEMHRDATGKVPEVMYAKIYEFSSGSDPRIDIGHTLVAGLQRRQLMAEYIATEVTLALQYRFGREHHVTA